MIIMNHINNQREFKKKNNINLNNLNKKEEIKIQQKNMMICKIIMKIITIKIIWIISHYNNNKIKFREEIRN